MGNRQHPHLLHQRIAQDKFEFYVTKFTPSTTTEMIADYMHKNGVSDLENTKVTCLVPRNKDRSTINFVSFKIDTIESVAKLITNAGFWPKKCLIKEFVQKSLVDLTKSTSPSNADFFQSTSRRINNT